jgi:hypothetical protein
MRSTHSHHVAARPNVVIDRRNAIGRQALTSAQPHSKPDHRANGWRWIIYTAVLLPILFLGILACTSLDFSNPDIPDWKPVLALADTAQEKGDLYYAKSLYSQVGRLAARREDWEGLIAAACAMYKLDNQKGRYSPTNALLLHAMIAAETKQSRSGMTAVAKGFTGLGEDKVAAMVVSRIQKDWPENAMDAAPVVSPGCWAN